MPSLDNLTPDARIMALFIGRSGTGKKAAAASFPGPIDFLDFDGRIRGILGCSWINPKNLGNVEIFPPKNKKGEFSFDKINEHLDLLTAQANIGTLPYKTLYLGSLTGLAFGLLQDALILTHKDGRGLKMGALSVTAPLDYKFESQGAKQMLAHLRYLKDHPTGIANIIVGAHTVPRWGKSGIDFDTDPALKEKIEKEKQYQDNVVIGEKISLTDKLSEECQIYFDHIWRFDKRMEIGNNQPQHYVQFRSDIARTTFSKLPNGEINITDKPFYEGVMRLAGFRQNQPQEVIAK